jgi:hypothetical protein
MEAKNNFLLKVLKQKAEEKRLEELAKAKENKGLINDKEINIKIMYNLFLDALIILTHNKQNKFSNYRLDKNLKCK